jgi:hypothetical protein
MKAGDRMAVCCFRDNSVGIGSAHDAIHHRRLRVFPRWMRFPARPGDSSNLARHHRRRFRRWSHATRKLLSQSRRERYRRLPGVLRTPMLQRHAQMRLGVTRTTHQAAGARDLGVVWLARGRYGAVGGKAPVFSSELAWKCRRIQAAGRRVCAERPQPRRLGQSSRELTARSPGS